MISLAEHSFLFLFVIAGRGLNLRPFLETFAPIYMPTLITTHPRTADLGKPCTVIIGGETSGLEVHNESKGPEKQSIRTPYGLYSLSSRLYPGPLSNTIASSFYRYIERQQRFAGHSEEATPRLMPGIVHKAFRNTLKYIGQKVVNVYLIDNVISGKTPKIFPGKVSNFRPAINRLVWKFTVMLSVTNFPDKLTVRTGLTSYIPYNKSNILNHRAS
jgi:hypothetical protein